MKICRKILSIISAAAVFSAMTVSVFAAGNGVTTTVTYDISTGKANVVTSGTATAGKEVAHIVYTGDKPDENSILYLDQDTAGTDGAFSFKYSVATEKLSDTSISVVGTDGEPINYESTGNVSTDIAASVKLTVTCGAGITVTLRQDDSATTVAAGTADKIVYVRPGADVTYTVESASEYIVNNVLCTGAYTTNYSADTVVTVDAVPEDVNFAGWGTSSSSISYGAVVTSDTESASAVAFSKPAEAPEEGSLEDITGTPDTYTFYSTVNTAMIRAAVSRGYAVEYGIIFLPGQLAGGAELNADTAGAYILPAYQCESGGDWGICVIDNYGDRITNYTARTYVKIGENYAYGTIVHK